MTTTTKYNDHHYVKLTAALRRAVETNGLPCHLCGKHIDLTLPYTHPMSFTADHLNPIANGGPLHSTLAPAHRRCNSRRGNRQLPSAVRQGRVTRQW